MTGLRLRWRLATGGLVLAAWAVVYLAIITFDPPAYDPAGETAAKVNFGLAVILFIPTVVYIVAAQLLLYFWLTGAGARLSEMDAPGRVLAVAVASLPGHRREWGAAMVGELAEVRGRAARWRFALSCVRAALWPRPRSWPLLVLAGLAVAGLVAAAPAIGETVAGLKVLAVTCAALAGALALLTVARSPRPRIPAPALLVVAGVAAAIAMIVVFLRREPSAAEFLSPAKAVLIAAIMAGSLWIALASPRVLGPSGLAARLGAGAALAAVVGQLLLGRIANEVLDKPAPLMTMGALFLVFGPAFLFFVPACWAAMADRSLRSGLKAGAWTAAAYLPLVFAMWLYEAMRVYAATGRLFIDVDPGPIGANLDQAVFWCLTYVPVVGAPLAVFGAGIAAYIAKSLPKR
jgi:hypothetical protein